VSAKRLQRRIIELITSNPNPTSLQQLRQVLQVPERTLRYHLAILRRSGLLRETFSFSDRRRKLLSISKKCNVNLIMKQLEDSGKLPIGQEVRKSGE
jgi:DNA-binding transcriptional ArsR family regulator